MKIRILELDALRGIAVIAVILFHFTMGQSQSIFNFNIGAMGVDLFFIISGFVIFMTIQKTTYWKAFAWSRFSRLYPTYWFCVTLTTLIIILKSFIIPVSVIEHGMIWKYLVNMTMVQYYFNIDSIDGPYWTLIIELVFYSFIILLMLTKTIKYIEYIGVVFMLFCLCYTFDVVANNIYFQNILVALPIISYFPLFYAGIILYKMKFEKLTIIRMSLFAFTLIIQCFLFRHCYYNTKYISLTEYIVTLSVIYGVFILYLFNKLKVIVNPITIWLGQLSYSLYLIHQYIGVSVIIPGLMKYLHLSFWMSSTISFIIILSFAHLIHQYIEKPSILFLRRNRNSVNN